MTVCTACGNNAPDDMRHCSQCGARLPEPEPEAPGKTGHFGDQDIKNLMSKMEREQPPPIDEGNLLAGLPRPKVGSMLSPLRGGQTSPADRKPEKRARSASGSTVMGMPLFSTGEQRAVPMPRPRTRPADADAPAGDIGAALTGGPSIQSLDSFKDDVNDAPRPDPEAVPPDAEPGDTPAEATPGGDGTADPVEPTVEPAVAPTAADDAASLPELPGPGALDVTSPARPTEPSPAVGSSSGNGVIVVIIAAVLAGLAFFLLK